MANSGQKISIEGCPVFVGQRGSAPRPTAGTPRWDPWAPYESRPSGPCAAGRIRTLSLRAFQREKACPWQERGASRTNLPVAQGASSHRSVPEGDAFRWLRFKSDGSGPPWGCARCSARSGMDPDALKHASYKLWPRTGPLASSWPERGRYPLGEFHNSWELSRRTSMQRAL